MITFTHKFFGGLSAEARRHVNPDGSEGGIVAISASIGAGVTISASAEVFPGATIGSGARIGSGTSIGDGARISSGARIGSGASISYGASIGGMASIGDGVSIGSGARIGSGASIGYGASISYGASIGDGVSIGDGDWWISTGPQGSREAMLTAVQTKDGLRWWVGCAQNITTEHLRDMVSKTHGENNHAADYLHVIDFVEQHPARLRNEAERKAGAA